MIVYLPGGKIMTCNEMPDELFCHDARHYSSKHSEQVKDYSFVETVDGNKQNYTRQQVQGADNAIVFNREIEYIRP